MPFRAGGGYNCGGITDSVELICAPAVYVDNLFVTAAPEQNIGKMHIEISVRNAAAGAKKSCVDVTVASARDGETTAAFHIDREFSAGNSTIKTT